jgi:hypothetical protein
MEQIRDATHRLLIHLGVTPNDAEFEEWEPNDLNFNPTVFVTLVDAANEDRRLIFACTRAIGALARFADRGRIKAEKEMEHAGTTSRNARRWCGQMLVDIFIEMFSQEPTETSGGPWEKFASWAFEFAGAPITPHSARELLRSAKQSPAYARTLQRRLRLG